jgi:bacterioferritin
MFESWGLKHMGQIIYDESIGEMKHADKLIKRILFLDGLPNMQDLHKLKIGENAVECLGADLQLELGGRATLLGAIAQAEQLSDYVSRQIFMEILSDTEEHIDFLEAQFKLIEQLGEQNYLQSAMTEIAPDKAATGG